MKTFKDCAYAVLKSAAKPLHISIIVKQAARRGLLKTSGQSPVATMGALLAVDVKKQKEKSRFVRVAPSTYAINRAYSVPVLKATKEAGKRVSEDFVKNAVIKWLSANGWGHFEFDDLHTHGVDIRARHHKYTRYFYIEAKGQGKIPQANESYFVSALGQIVTRMTAGKSTRTYYGLGLHEISANIARRRIPWQVAKKLLLYIFAVDAAGTVKQYSWKDLKRVQG